MVTPSVTFFIAVLALVFSAVGLFLLWRSGLFFSPIPTHRPLVRLPTLAVAARVGRRGSCNKEFRGTATITITYPAPPPPNRAEVQIRLSIVNRTNIASVSLSQEDLGVVRNNDTKRVTFDGTLTDECLDGSFAIFAEGTLIGTGASPSPASDAVVVPASPIKARAPGGITPQANGSFTYGARNPADPSEEVEMTCCAGAGAAGGYTVASVRPSNVTGVAAAPAAFACPGGPHFITVTGRLQDLTRMGMVTLEITAPGGGKCTVATQIEPAQ